MSGRVAVGRVGRPHGVAGAFFVEDPSEDAARYAVGARLYAGDVEAEIVESKQSGGRRVIRLDHEVSRGARLEVDRDSLPATGPDEYYVFELVGLDVVRADGTLLGSVANVEPGVANDVLELDTGPLLPLVGACVREIDLNARTIVVEPGFEEAD
jgi:16S rRNA processing protein RimM